MIDDASHKYVQTVASFDTLFPVVRPGGWYVVEDWAWCFDERFLAANPGWRAVRPLAPIVLDIAANMATRPDAIASVEMFPDFVAVQRGPAELDARFRLDLSVAARRRPIDARLARKVRRLASRLRLPASGSPG